MWCRPTTGAPGVVEGDGLNVRLNHSSGSGWKPGFAGSPAEQRVLSFGIMVVLDYPPRPPPLAPVWLHMNGPEIALASVRYAISGVVGEENGAVRRLRLGVLAGAGACLRRRRSIPLGSA
jgi:hypothetical protein